MKERNMKNQFPIREDYPLSQTQMGIYIECNNRLGEAIYNNPHLYLLNKELDKSQVLKAIRTTLDKHSFVKTLLFVNSEGEIRQKRNDNFEYDLTIEKLSSNDFQRLKQDLVQPFNLLEDILFRIRLFEIEDDLYLFFDFHHIIFDGTSHIIFLEDLTAAYLEKEIEEESWSGFEVAFDEQQRLNSVEYTEARNWYLTTFDSLDIDSLPVRDQYDNELKYGKIIKDFDVDYDEIRAFRKKHNIPVSVLTSGVFGYLIGQYTGESASLFATIYNGRTKEEINRSMAMLVKTLPVYTSWKQDDEISNFLNQLKQQLQKSKQYDIFSFAELCSQIDLSSNVLFAYQGDYGEPDALFGKSVKSFPLLENATGENLIIEIFKHNNRLSAVSEYHANEYSDKFIQNLLDTYEQILKEFLVKNRLNEIELLSEPALQQLDSFNATEVEFDHTQTIISLFRKQVALNPDNIAVTYLDENYTYKEVDVISEKIAQYITSKDLGVGDVVSILIPRNPYMLIASLGVLKSGCAYQPLDNTYPAERINFMIQDAKAKLLITDESQREKASEYKGDILYLSEIEKLEYTDEKLQNPKPQSLFTLLYTSGTTGKPKGCCLYHDNIVAFCRWYQRYYKLTSDGNVGAYASYGFDANMMDMYPAITCGATCCIVAEDIRLDLEALSAYIEDSKISHMFMTTQVGRQFAIEYDTHPTLKYLSVGGEKLASMQPPSGYEFHNLYGPTECTILATAYEIATKKDNIPIGNAIDNVKLYIVNKEGKRVPAGAIGELWIAGVQVSHGYLNRPEKTKEVFLDNPFDNNPNYKRVYRTGDIVRYLQNGEIEFIGRRDAQVKIRGFRIELTEVESILLEHPDLSDATVVAYDEANGGKYIAAYVVSDKKVDINDIIEFIREQKPPYMVPAVIMQIDKIPLNQNMKVNKRALPTPKFEAEELKEDSNRPLNLLEQELKEIIKGIANTEDFGLTTDLGYIGITSISGIKLSSSILKRFGINIPVKKLTQGATVQSIENDIIANWLNHAPEHKKRVHKAKVSKAPLAYAQQGVHYDCLRNPDEIVYNIPAMLTLPANIDLKRLEKTLQAIINSQPYLMTSFKMEGDEVIQYHCPRNIKIDRHETTEKDLDAYKKEFVRPFDIEKDTLFRFAMVRTEKRTCLFLDFHHLIFDGASFDIFLKLLAKVYQGEELETETVSYYDYVLLEKEAEKLPGYQENKSYFDAMLRSCEGATELPADLYNNVEEGHLQECFEFINYDLIADFCKKYHYTPASICLSAVFYTVARYTNSNDVFISTISNGRAGTTAVNTFGMFVKTLPLGVELKEKSVDEFIKEAGKILAETIDHEDYPFAKISSDYGFNPHIVYAYQLGVLEENKIEGKKIEIEGLALKRPKFNVSIHIEERGGKPAIVVQYNDALYSKSLIEEFAISLNIVLENMMKNPKESILNVSMLNDERKNIVDSFRNVGEPQVGLLQQRFEQIAQSAPHKIALIASDGSYSYERLDKYANKIANGLITRGVKPRSKIIILLPRTSRLMMSIFGVLKSGSAYIPCDPEYPVERIKHILQDSNASYIITNKDNIDKFPADTSLDVEDLLACTDSSLPLIDTLPDDIAYMIYTSGSTGKPKGVILRHAGISNYLTPVPENRHIYALAKEATTLLSVTTISFDMSLKEFATALSNGLTLVLANELEANNPLLLSKLFLETKADAFNATPSRMMQYLELPDFCIALSNCKVVMCGGEKYPDSLLSKLQNITKARIFNTYGPTEITVSSNCKELTQAESVTIGAPLLNYSEFIADSDGNELPVGVVGELYIGGVGVAKGYHNLDEMTAEKFVDYKGVRVYKSGDYAKWTPEGDVVVLGRKDNQVKLRGLRIELGEVEAAISSVKGIQSAVVIIKKIRGAEHLCAYFTADHNVDIEHLRTEIKKGLTLYMVPTAFMQLQKLPLTPNGKTDLKALPEPKLLTGKGEAASNEIEQSLCDIFSRILNIEQIGVTDSFFELGGTSLSVARIIIEGNKLGFSIAYGDVFLYPSPRELAAFLQKDMREEVNQNRLNNPQDEFNDYDYAAIQEVLDANSLDNFINGKPQELGDILLTGATGYLGSHLLKELIENHEGKIYCLLRTKNSIKPEMRLKSSLFYYFENSFEELFGERIIPIEGDITKTESFKTLKDKGISTVFNCAANVKHFSKDNDIELVNINGVENLIDFCLKSDIRLIQVSTMSVGGLLEVDKDNKSNYISEQMLYFGQLMDNKYIRSKFLAERLILEKIAKSNLNAKIMRVGNLSARNSDGEFQINYTTNSFMGRLKSYRILGKCTYEQLDTPLEFSPIDEVVKAIFVLSKTPKECCVFHPYNHHYILLGDIFIQMSHLGFNVEAVEKEVFNAEMAKAEADPQKAKILSSMIAYQNMAHGKAVSLTLKNNVYTMQVLYRLGYHWPITSWDYVTRFVEALQGLGFFDE